MTSKQIKDQIAAAKTQGELMTIMKEIDNSILDEMIKSLTIVEKYFGLDYRDEFILHVLTQNK